MQAILERRQIPIYLTAFGLALCAGLAMPALAGLADWLEPALAVMMFATFLQLPLGQLRQAAANRRFLLALLGANFLAIPALVALLLPLMPTDPVVRFGMLLVLLAPCIDYVILFAHLGRAQAGLLLAATPLLLAAQALALPLLLPLLGGGMRLDLPAEPMLRAFALLIVAPLLLAWAAQSWRDRLHAGVRATLDMLPVPATAAVLALVAASMAPQLGQASGTALAALPAYVAFAVLAPIVGALASRAARLPPPAGRAVAFSAATRNSLVVLPFGLAVPDAGAILATVIVTQTLVELLAELVYIRWVPRLLPDRIAA